jgi:hypothetical protein
MIQNFVGLETALVALLAALTGALFFRGWMGWMAARSQRPPRRCPLQARAVVSAEEHKVWLWLQNVFGGYQILLKTPVTCFTRSPSREGGLRWHPLLRGMYCTFAVCTPQGHVLGCIDVLKEGDHLPRSHRQFRRALLSRCSIAYSVVQADRLPSMDEIRLELLGDAELSRSRPYSGESELIAARWELRAAIDNRREVLRGDAARAAVASESVVRASADEGPQESAFYSGSWQQYDSFIAPLDGPRSSPD